MNGVSGEVIRADIDPKGNIWVFHRCFNTEPAGALPVWAVLSRRFWNLIRRANSDKFGGGMFRIPARLYRRRTGKHMGERRQYARDSPQAVSEGRERHREDTKSSG
jgi:hypothetical protein